MKNLLFIWTDEQRADTMACYGNAQIKTPHLNRFAEQSFVFDRAYCTQPVCTPSRATIMTGLWPHTHGCVRNNQPLPRDAKTLAEMLPDDYATGYFGKWHLGDEINAQHGWDTWLSIEDDYRRFYSDPADRERFSGYHLYLERLGFPKDKTAPDGAAIYSRKYAAVFAERHTKARFLGREAARFIRDQAGGDRPWALSVNMLEPHMPFFGPSNDLHNPDQLVVGEAFGVLPPDNAAMNNRLKAARFTQQGFEGLPLDSDADWRRLRANYYGLMSLVDAAVGEMLAALDESGQADDTLVVYTSDHGEMMGDHCIVGKGVMYEESVRIPLLVRAPWLSKEQQLIDGRVSQIDLTPTVLDLLDAGLPDHLQGETRRAVLEGDATLQDNDVIVEWNGGDDTPKDVRGFEPREIDSVGSQTWRTIITADGWKLALCPTDQCELYDMSADPCEMHNRYDDPSQKQRIADLTQRIRTWQQRANDDATLPAV